MHREIEHVTGRDARLLIDRDQFWRDTVVDAKCEAWSQTRGPPLTVRPPFWYQMLDDYRLLGGTLFSMNVRRTLLSYHRNWTGVHYNT